MSPFIDQYEACPAGTQSGDHLQVTECTGTGDSQSCNTSVLGVSECYAPSSSWTSIEAIDLTGTFGGGYWVFQSTRSVSGWAVNPDFGPIPSMTLDYERARQTVQTQDTWADACPSLSPLGSGGNRCTVASSPQCVDGPSSKTIDGVPVQRDCWDYQSTLTCAGGAAADQCAPLLTSGCTPLTSVCARSDLSTGACAEVREQVSCSVPDETFTTVSNCPNKVFCIGGGCFDIAYANDQDFARSLSMLEGAREAGVYLDTDHMQVFKGEADHCRERLLTNCCTSDSAGRGMTNQSVMGKGSNLVYDLLMNSENRQFVTQGLQAMLLDSGFSGSYSSYGFTIAVNGTALPEGSTALYASSTEAGEGFVLAFDPWSLAIMVIIYVILSMMSCSQDEARVAMQQGAGLCHTVGSYCSGCILFCSICTEHTEGKCCFNSMLSRIINEQGRAQIGKGWGDPENPDCSGFTVAQLQSLNLAAMDLSEFYASLSTQMPNLSKLQDSNDAKVPNCYFGQGKCQ